MDNFKQRAEKIIDARKSEEIFGDSLDSALSLIEQYRVLTKLFYPDQYEDAEQRTVARLAYIRIKEHYEEAVEKFKGGTYGKVDDTIAFEFITQKNKFIVVRGLAEGDISNIYEAVYREGDCNKRAIVKIVVDSDDNSFVDSEFFILKSLHGFISPQIKHLPKVVDRFKTNDGRNGIVLERLDGCYDISAIRESPKYKNGIPEEHVVWMMARSLSVLGYAHSKGIIHGNVEPNHLMVRPDNHNVFLIDWSYAFYSNEGQFKVVNDVYSAPEISRKQTPLPSADLYSLGKAMIFALGGNPKDNTLPGSVDERFTRFLMFFVMQSPWQRPQDAWEMYSQLQDLVINMWGPKQFREFVI